MGGSQVQRREQNNLKTDLDCIIRLGGLHACPSRVLFCCQRNFLIQLFTNWTSMCSCSLFNFPAVQVLLLEAQETFYFGYSGYCRWISEEDLSIFEKTLAFSENGLHSADVNVVSCHAIKLTRSFALLWLADPYFFSNLIGWKQIIQLFRNLDTFVVSIVNVSNETIQLIINWTVRRIIAWSIL